MISQPAGEIVQMGAQHFTVLRHFDVCYRTGLAMDNLHPFIFFHRSCSLFSSPLFCSALLSAALFPARLALSPMLLLLLLLSLFVIAVVIIVAPSHKKVLLGYTSRFKDGLSRTQQASVRVECFTRQGNW